VVKTLYSWFCRQRIFWYSRGYQLQNCLLEHVPIPLVSCCCSSMLKHFIIIISPKVMPHCKFLMAMGLFPSFKKWPWMAFLFHNWVSQGAFHVNCKPRCARKYVWCCKIYICAAFSRRNPIPFSYLSQLLKNSHILEYLPFSFYANKRALFGSKILHGMHLDDFCLCYLGALVMKRHSNLFWLLLVPK